MGALRFALHPPELADERPELRSAYVTGMDRMPYRTYVELGEGALVCRRDVPESGSVNVPWAVEQFGEVMLRSATLMERADPYHLQVELARGKVNQLRNHTAEWEVLGLKTPPALRGELREVGHDLSRALAVQSDPLEAAAIANQTLTRSLWTTERLTSLYLEHLFQVRLQHYAYLNTLLSCRVAADSAAVVDSAEFRRAFNAVTVQFSWRDVEPVEGQYCWEQFDELVEWCLKHHFVLKGGPLITWSTHALPDWLWLWEQDFDSLLSFASDYIETVIARYRGRIRIWEVAARTNCDEALGLSEEQRLRLTVRALDVARESDPEAVSLITLGQPWGEYMARHDYQYSPIHFADALLRADLGMAALGIELVMGYDKGGSYCRDIMEVSDVLDYYSQLGIPLHVLLAAPSGTEPDRNAADSWQLGGGSWHKGWSEQTQADWLDHALRVASSKPYVQGITWSHFSDASRHEFPAAGLVRADGDIKPALERVIQLREQHLPRR